MVSRYCHRECGLTSPRLLPVLPTLCQTSCSALDFERQAIEAVCTEEHTVAKLTSHLKTASLSTTTHLQCEKQAGVLKTLLPHCRDFREVGGIQTQQMLSCKYLPLA